MNKDCLNPKFDLATESRLATGRQLMAGSCQKTRLDNEVSHNSRPIPTDGDRVSCEGSKSLHRLRRGTLG
jgi:hypothetical protein